jgi:prepilin-type N-terminal cleavage/methylation domain-containing protein
MSPRPIFRRVWLRIRALYRVTTMKLHTRRAFTVIEVMIVIVIIGLLAALAIPAFKHVRQSKPYSSLYQAWIKAHRRPDLTYEEWLLLFHSNTLPVDTAPIPALGPVE